jgi:hypothetical protein
VVSDCNDAGIDSGSVTLLATKSEGLCASISAVRSKFAVLTFW